MSKKGASEKPQRVTIDLSFVTDQAKDAVHQFFRPITGPFELARPAPTGGKPKTGDSRRKAG